MQLLEHFSFYCLTNLLFHYSSICWIQHLNNFDLLPPLDNSNKRFPVVNTSSLGPHSTVLSVNLHSRQFHFSLKTCKQSCFLMNALTLLIILSVLYLWKWLIQISNESFSHSLISASALLGTLLTTGDFSNFWDLSMQVFSVSESLSFYGFNKYYPKTITLHWDIKICCGCS